VDGNPLVAIKTGTCCSIKTHRLRPQRERYCIRRYTCMRSLKVLFACQSLLLFSIIHYPEILFTGSKSTCIGYQLLPHREMYGFRQHSCMRPLYRFSIW
jgi:hypothetical protein